MPVVCSSNSQHPCDTQQISLPRGTTLSLICKYVEGTITWSKNRDPLPADCQKSTISARCFTQNLRGEEVRKQRLTIRNITKRDEGNYTCKANNEESPLFLVIIKVSEDPTVLRNNTNKPTAFSGSPTDAQGTNWSSTAPPTETPTVAVQRNFSQPSSHTSTALFLVTGSTSKRDVYNVYII